MKCSFELQQPPVTFSYTICQRDKLKRCSFPRPLEARVRACGGSAQVSPPAFTDAGADAGSQPRR